MKTPSEGFRDIVQSVRLMALAEDLDVVICRGPAKGCTRPEGECCPDCYRIAPNDPRSTDQVLRDMERGNG